MYSYYLDDVAFLVLFSLVDILVLVSFIMRVQAQRSLGPETQFLGFDLFGHRLERSVIMSYLVLSVWSLWSYVISLVFNYFHSAIYYSWLLASVGVNFPDIAAHFHNSWCSEVYRVIAQHIVKDILMIKVLFIFILLGFKYMSDDMKHFFISIICELIPSGYIYYRI